MKLRGNIKFFLLAIFLINGFFVIAAKSAVESSSTIGVQVSIPGGGGSGGSPVVPPPQPETDNPPTISSVGSSVSYTSAQVSWSASDDKGVASTAFVYGLSQTYGQSASPAGSYSVDLSGLATGTVYYYKITAVDTAGHNTDYTGNFQTLVYNPPVVFPNISNIILSPGINSAAVTFDTDKDTISQVKYGTNTDLVSSAFEGVTASKSHNFTLLNLSANKTYYYKIIATDSNLNSTSTAILNFKTLADTTAPPNVSDLQIVAGNNSFNLSWKNPSLSFTPDFSGVKVLRKIGSKATGPNDSSATVVYNGKNESLSNDIVVAGFNYFYTVFSYDTSGNFSSGNFISGIIILNNQEICNDGIDNNNDGKVDCADSSCVNDQNCQITPIDQNPINPNPPNPPSDTSAGGGGLVPACNDNQDNDSDGLIDFPNDPGCTSFDDNDEYNPPTSTVPEFEKVSLDDFNFFAGSRQIELTPKSGTILGLSGSNLSITIKKSKLVGSPSSLVLRVGDTDQYQFVLGDNNTYYADILFPQKGTKQAFIEIDYGANQLDSLGINLQAINFGNVTDNAGDVLSGVEVNLNKEGDGNFPATIYGQQNPKITDGSGSIGWMVPNGRFFLTAKKDGYYDYSGPVFEVKNNIINFSLKLVGIPPKIQDVIDPNASVIKNVSNVAKNLAQKTGAATAVAVKQVQKAAAVVQEVASDPQVKQVANQVVAPTAVGVAAVGTVALVSWADILPLLRFLFLQPVLLIGRGKREKWGIVYNSLSKLPVDLALVRLFNIDSNKLVQTKVTSSDGRYFFVVDAGRYRIEVRKGNFLFPTSLLKGFQRDGKRIDIYHGEEISVTDKGSVITANIPLDPAGEKLKTPKRLIFLKTMRHVQNALSWVGLIVTTVSLYISPVWYMWILLGTHLALTFVFRRLAKPSVAKGWGIIYDDQTKKPLSQVVARLFDSKFNKLVATEVTGPDGKYYFMAGDNQYYVSYERQGYKPLKTDIIDLTGKTADTIAKDVSLKKK